MVHKPNKFKGRLNCERHCNFPPPKKKKTEEEEMSSELLPELPEEIVLLIMCKLSTEEGARTVSFVSRRWNQLWNTTLQTAPKLSFHMDNIFPKLRDRLDRLDKQKLGRKSEQIVEEVNRVLCKMHRAPTLEEFKLGWNLTSRNSSDITKWLEFAARKRVKKLMLEFDPDFCLETHRPHYLASKTLDKLSMHWLRDLHIRRVNAHQGAIDSIFSNSPFLERLTLIDLEILTLLKIVSAPNLNHFHIGSCRNLRCLGVSAPNLNTMQISNLSLTNGIDISSVPNLSNVIISIANEQDFVLDSYRMLFNQVKRLELCIKSLDDTWGQFPELSNVEELELSLLSCDMIPIYCLRGFLKAAPLLHTLSVKWGHNYQKHPARDHIGLKWMKKYIHKKVKAKASGRHSHQCLKVVKVSNFVGAKYELKFALRLLKYAVSVEKIIIQLCPSGSSGDFEENQYKKLCRGCAQLLKNQILEMHLNSNVIIIT